MLQGSPGRLLVGVFCIYAGIGMVWSVITVYATALGASATVAGAMISAYGAARLLVNLPAGIASERFGRARVMRVSVLALAVGSFAALGVGGVLSLLFCLLLQGMAAAAYATAAMSAVTDGSTADTRVSDMAAYQAATATGLSIGPGLGGILAAAWGYDAPFFMQGMMALIALLALRRMSLDRHARIQQHATPATKGLLGLLAGVALMTYAAFFTRVAGNWILLPLVARGNFDMGIGTIGVLLTVGAVANLAVLPATAPAAQRLGRKPMLMLATAMLLIGLWLMATPGPQWLLWAVTLLIGAGTGLSMPMLSAYCADAAPAGRVGAAVGLMRTMMDLGAISGPILAGICVDQLGLGSPGGIGLCGAVLLVSTLIFVFASPRSRASAQ